MTFFFRGQHAGRLHRSRLRPLPPVVAAESPRVTPAPLEVEALGLRYRRNRPWAVHNVSFSIPRGAVVALVGPNGAGKSTLIRACLGFVSPDAGRVLVLGADPAVDRKAAVEAIGYIPQGLALYGGLSIDDHFILAVGARPSFDRAFAARRIGAVGLDGGRKVGELSGGEQAQVALALALGTRAPLLVLDEPLASLDPLARRDFLTALSADLREREATAMISSHLIVDVERYCDWLIVLANGQLALAGSIADARRQFGVVIEGEQGAAPVIGTFADQSGTSIALVNGRGDREASLEEIVLGHLASARAPGTGSVQ